MNSSFNQHLGFDDNKLLREIILVSDRGIDANFTLHHFAAHYIRNNGKVCQLGFAQTVSHYINACHKLGLNLERAIETKQYVFIDALKFLFDGFVAGDGSSNLFDIKAEDYSLKSLLDMIVGESDKTMIVLIDDLTSLVNVGVSVQTIADFIHYCKVLSSQKMLSFVFLVHDDEDDPDFHLLHMWLKHYATLELHVRALKTGYSRELSGEMNILRHSYVDGIISKLLHFKLLDKDVKFFHPGTSSAVL